MPHNIYYLLLITYYEIVVLDGFAANPGDLSWEGLKALGECTIMTVLPPKKYWNAQPELK